MCEGKSFADDEYVRSVEGDPRKPTFAEVSCRFLYSGSRQKKKLKVFFFSHCVCPADHQLNL